mmetsp:Transcript_31772/g.38389  ORF Transcript_31772/g.38389 Transcript_31772/m.38389 type:complete len:770 (-) Transcript_31772:897-3206(-)|eukprot:CAMPEP_0197856524 /NCGR_PEP_ID=MMETSP1438-20131217/28725_1 /TAXON_ID=1461541 /ORGANISM="Pterosperma sp., Strain CCMP1384" /LENGTH=769 /DNA_ID=CAMNT_0043472003 /DNA_START=103 /DNA_END=2412 /DNA_ORIENTATION=-
MALVRSLLGLGLVSLPTLCLAADYPVDIPYKDWGEDNEDIQSYWEALATQTGGAGILAATILAAVLLILIIIFWCPCCGCVRCWSYCGAPGPSMRSAAAAMLGLTVVVIAAMCGLVHTNATKSLNHVETLLNETTSDLIDETANWLCGGNAVNELFFNKNSMAGVKLFYNEDEYCAKGTVAGFVVEVDQMANTTLDKVVQFVYNLSSIEPPIQQTKDELTDSYAILQALGSGGGVKSMTDGVETLRVSLDYLSVMTTEPMVEENGGPFLPMPIPDGAFIPTFDDSYMNLIIQAENKLGESLNDVNEIYDDTFSTLQDLQVTTVATIHDSYNDIHKQSTDLVDDALDIVDNLAVDRRHILHAKTKIKDDWAPLIVSISAALLGIFLMFGLCETVGAYQYDGAGKVVGRIGGCCSYIFVFWLTCLVGIIAVVHLFVDDTCTHLNEGVTKESPGILQVNTETETIQVGDTNVVLGPHIDDILFCPKGCTSPNSVGCNATNNLVSILGIQNEFNFTSKVVGPIDELRDAQNKFNVHEEIDRAQLSIQSEDVVQALNLDFSQDWGQNDYVEKLSAIEDALPKSANNPADADKWMALYYTTTPSKKQVDANSEILQTVRTAKDAAESLNEGINGATEAQQQLEGSTVIISAQLSVLKEILDVAIDNVETIIASIQSLVDFVYQQSFGVFRCGWVGKAYTIVTDTFCGTTMDSIYLTVGALAGGIAMAYLGLGIIVFAVRADPEVALGNMTPVAAPLPGSSPVMSPPEPHLAKTSL